MGEQETRCEPLSAFVQRVWVTHGMGRDDKAFSVTKIAELEAERDALQRVVEAARNLVQLRDGLRDVKYDHWAALRLALEALHSEPEQPALSDTLEGEQPDD